MSWSVSAEGSVGSVIAELDRQFAYPLADAPAGITDEGERETVRQIRGAIRQCLGTFALGTDASVSASGHLEAGAGQIVNVSIKPKR